MGPQDLITITIIQVTTTHENERNARCLEKIYQKRGEFGQWKKVSEEIGCSLTSSATWPNIGLGAGGSDWSHRLGLDRLGWPLAFLFLTLCIGLGLVLTSPVPATIVAWSAGGLAIPGGMIVDAGVVATGMEEVLEEVRWFFLV